MDAANLVDVLRYRAQDTPCKIALRTKTTGLSCRYLDEASRLVGQAIAAAGIAPSARAAILCKNSPSQLESGGAP
jgi:acyl-CoA synthetase (AMP-forming)/AMP-acid ligase II